jgi:hypothetical protein
MPVFVLDLRSADVGGAVVPGHLTLGTLDDFRACGELVFLLHGFNVSRPNGSAELQALANLLPLTARAGVVATLWPGDSSAGAISYAFETSKADDSAVELAKFIGDNLTQPARISFVAHSLGSRVAMQTVMQLRTMATPVDQVCLMAAAIDNDSLASRSAYRGAAEFAGRVAVLSSPSDTVLRYAYPAGNILSAFIHWTATADAALGLLGPRAGSASDGPVPDAVVATGIPAAAGVLHSDYVPNAQPPPSAAQLAAARYVSEVLAGTAPLSYG